MSNTKENKNKFHILITNNETGETLMEHDACVILGGCVISDEASTGIVCVHGSSLDIAKAIQAANNSIKAATIKNPKALLLSMVLDEVTETEEKIIEKDTEEGEV